MASKLPQNETLLMAGIDPNTKLPVRLIESKLADNMKRVFRIIDEQDAVNRYVWFNLPANITSQELERMLYYKGQLCFFFIEGLGFYFMPYALDGTIDFYGRYNSVHPIPFTSGKEEEQSKTTKEQTALLSKMKLKCVYTPKTEEELEIEDLTNSCVLLHDYTKQLSQNVIPRVEVNDGLLDVMSEIVPYLRTSLIASTGIKGMRVNDADQYENVKYASRSIKKSALQGELFTPIIANTDLQEFTDGSSSSADPYLMALQSLDNLRLSTYGLENGGLFEKKAHILNAEAELNNSSVGLVNQDGISIRQHFCNVVNSIWGLGIWCEPSENVLAVDLNGDGVAYDENINEDENIDEGVEDGNEDNL